MADPVVSEVAGVVLPTFDLRELVRKIAHRLEVDEDTASLILDREYDDQPEDLQLETA
ncbi:hypothetical protein [Kribbella catacumbae]|uniref:hypothetical protein n=1 Tax=Kribbella catacumbae TaxID=460086 RepID=UPI0003AA81F3|nr:hypothetical protein [Kribbella catacumbae]